MLSFEIELVQGRWTLRRELQAFSKMWSEDRQWLCELYTRSRRLKLSGLNMSHLSRVCSGKSPYSERSRCYSDLSRELSSSSRGSSAMVCLQAKFQAYPIRSRGVGQRTILVDNNSCEIPICSFDGYERNANYKLAACLAKCPR